MSAVWHATSNNLVYASDAAIRKGGFKEDYDSRSSFKDGYSCRIQVARTKVQGRRRIETLAEIRWEVHGRPGYKT